MIETRLTLQNRAEAYESMPAGEYARFDRRDLFTPEPTESERLVRGEAEQLSEYFSRGRFELVVADPPYSNEDANHYGTILCNRGKVIEECHKVLRPGRFLVWLDQVIPMFSKENWKLTASIGVFISTNHRVRGTFIFEAV